MVLFKPFPSSWLALPVLHVLGCDRADLEQPHGEQVWEWIQQKDCFPEAALGAGPLVMHRAVGSLQEAELGLLNLKKEKS